MGRGCRSNASLCRLCLLMDLQQLRNLGCFNVRFDIRLDIRFDITQESDVLLWQRVGSAFSFHGL